MGLITLPEALEQLDIAQERIRQLESEMKYSYSAPLVFKLTRSEEAFFAIIMKRNRVTTNQLMTFVYGDAENSGANLIKVFIWKLRKKLKPFGIEILTVWGQGYYIPNDQKQRVLELLEAEETKKFQ